MQYQKTLIDKAAKICGSDAELCRRAQISPALLSLMRSGKRAMTPVTAAVLADIAGENAREVALDAVIESAKGTRLESAIREILGKALVAGVAGMLVFSYSADSHAATDSIAKTTYKNATSYTSYLIRLSDVLRALFALPGRRAALRLRLATQAMRRLWPLPDRQTAEALRALFIKHEQTTAVT